MSPTSPRLSRNRKRLPAIIALAILVGLAGGALIALRRSAPRPERVTVGKQLPTMTVYDARGAGHDLNALAPGKKKVIAFYSPTCDVCMTEMPQLQPFPEGVALVMVKVADLDAPDPAKFPKNAAAQLVDRDGIFMRTFPMTGVPALLFVNEQGVLLDGMTGAHQPGALQKRLQEFARPAA
jgi:thiol-disulfide isomerase/thioredoxin